MSPDIHCERRAAKQHGVITREQALKAGFTKRMISDRTSSGRWRRVLPGVFFVGQGQISYKTWLMAAVLWAGPGAVVSGPSAGWLFGLKHCDGRTVQITVPRKMNSAFGIKVRCDPLLDRSQGAIVDGIPATRPARTILDVCAFLKPHLASEMVADAIRRKVVSVSKLANIVETVGGKGVRGTKTLRKVLADRFAVEVTDSDAEDLFLRMARRRGYRFVFHHMVRRGPFVAELDFSLPHIQLDIEIDGYKDHGDPVALQRDKNRDAELTRIGWAVLRFTYWDLVQRPDWVFQCIAGAIAERSPQQLSI